MIIFFPFKNKRTMFFFLNLNFVGKKHVSLMHFVAFVYGLIIVVSLNALSNLTLLPNVTIIYRV